MKRRGEIEDALGERARREVVLYARVSSKEQEREGYSIPAQERLLRGYAIEHGLEIVREFTDVETAKDSGRSSFNEMLAFLRRHRSCRTVLVEKTDRLYRNLKDWVTVDEFDLEIHLVKEGVILSPDAKSAEKFMHGIRVLMAKNYIDNLSEEVRKGQREKAETGIWPSHAPLGYMNVITPEGKRTIAPDPERAPLVAKLFEWYGVGDVSIKELTRRAREAGLNFRRMGNPVNSATIHHLLRTQTFSGEFVWKGRVFKGGYEPLVTKDLWNRVQELLESRCVTKPKRRRQEFIFSGLIRCARCGCQLTAEIKKGKYVYYHCTGRRGPCHMRYTREEIFDERVGRELDRLRLPDEMHQWLVGTLKASHQDETSFHGQAVERLQAEYGLIQKRLDRMYEDKLDGTVAAAYFERRSNEWRAQQAQILEDIQRHQTANRTYVDQGIQILDLARNAAVDYRDFQTLGKKQLLDAVIEGAQWDDETLKVTLRFPFNLLAEATDHGVELMRPGPLGGPGGGSVVSLTGTRMRVRTGRNSQGSNSSELGDSSSKSANLVPAGARNTIWLGRKDSNLQPSDPERYAISPTHFRIGLLRLISGLRGGAASEPGAQIWRKSGANLGHRSPASRYRNPVIRRAILFVVGSWPRTA